MFSILFDRDLKAINTTIQRQQFVQNIIDALPSGVCIYDVRQNKDVFINRAFAEALGSVPAKEPQKAGFIRSVMHPDDWQPFLDYVKKLSGLSDDEPAEFEFRLRHSSGFWRWFQTRDKVFSRNEDGSVREIISIATDITERKNAEDEARFMTDLDRAVKPLTDPKEVVGVTVRMLA